MKRQIDDNDRPKRLKSTISHFEYLDAYDIYLAFYTYNQRFKNLILKSSSTTFQVHIPNISRIDFEHYRKDFVLFHRQHIKCLRISNSFVFEQLLSPPRIITDFRQLHTLILQQNDIRFLSKTIDHHLRKRPKLQSLTISITDTIYDPSCLIFSAICLPRLKRFEFNYPTDFPLYFYGHGSSSLETLIINSSFRFHCLGELLITLTNIRYLSIETLVGLNHSSIDYADNHFNKQLKYVNIKIEGVPFHSLHFLVENYFKLVEEFYLTVRHMSTIIEAVHWQELLRNHMPNIRYFDLNYIDTSMTNIREFQAFYHERKSSFACQENEKSNIIYSIEPYRRKKFTFFWPCHKTDRSVTQFKSVRQLKIRGTQVTHCFSYFPNVINLKLENYFQLSNQSIVNTLQQLLSLNQLKTISITDISFPFYELLNILRLTPNIHSIQLKRLVLFPSPTFQSFIQIKSLTLDQTCTLDIFKLILQTFPNLNFIKIGIHLQELKATLDHILAQTDHQLHSVCLSDLPKRYTKELKNYSMIKHFLFKLINRQLYLWW